ESKLAKHACQRKNCKEYPQGPPVQLCAIRHAGGFAFRSSLTDYKQRCRENQQRQKRQRRLQEEHNRKIKPDTMRIRMAQNIGWTAGAKCKPDQPSQVRPWRHNAATEQGR